MTDIALDEKAMGAAIAEPDDTQWHIDRMDSIVRDLWAANDIDLHMCNDTVKRNQSGLLHDIRNSWRIVRRAYLRSSPSQVAPQPQAGEAVAYEPCDGCGERDPDKRCIGCLHPFALASPQPANPAQVMDAMVEAADNNVLLTDAVWLEGLAFVRTGDEASRLKAIAYRIRAALTAAIGAGGQAVRCPRCDGTGSMQSELRGFEHCTVCDGAGKVASALSQPHPAAPSDRFARWLGDGPRLAGEAGCYVEIKVTALSAKEGR